jgi:hypothetical protein
MGNEQQNKILTMTEYYISPFNFFYAKNEELGCKFSKSSFGCYFTSESDNFDLQTILSMVGKGFQENENEFNNAGIDYLVLIDNVVKRVY